LLYISQSAIFDTHRRAESSPAPTNGASIPPSCLHLDLSSIQPRCKYLTREDVPDQMPGGEARRSAGATHVVGRCFQPFLLCSRWVSQSDKFVLRRLDEARNVVWLRLPASADKSSQALIPPEYRRGTHALPPHVVARPSLCHFCALLYLYLAAISIFAIKKPLPSRSYRTYKIRPSS